MRKTILYILLALFILLVVFVVQNTQPVALSFLWMSFSTTASLLVLGFLALGLISGWILSRLLELRMRTRKQVSTSAPSAPTEQS